MGGNGFLYRVVDGVRERERERAEMGRSYLPTKSTTEPEFLPEPAPKLREMRWVQGTHLLLSFLFPFVFLLPLVLSFIELIILLWLNYFFLRYYLKPLLSLIISDIFMGKYVNTYSIIFFRFCYFI